MSHNRADAMFATSDERRVPCVVQHGDSDDPRLRLTPDGAVRVTLSDRDAPPVNDPQRQSTELEVFAAELGRNEVWREILAKW